jgi:hypothetical protein
MYHRLNSSHFKIIPSFWVLLWFELRASGLLGMGSTTCATLPALLLLVVSKIESCRLFACADLEPNPSDLCFLNS